MLLVVGLLLVGVDWLITVAPAPLISLSTLPGKQGSFADMYLCSGVGPAPQHCHLRSTRHGRKESTRPCYSNLTSCDKLKTGVLEL